MKISQVFKDFKGRKVRLKEDERRQERGAKKDGLTDTSRHLQIPRHYGTLSWASREGRTGTWPYQKPDQTRTEPEFKFSAKQRGSASSPQLRLRPVPASRTRGLEKRGRIGRVKERKERGEGREVNKFSCSLPGRALWPVVHVRRRPGTKVSQLRPLGLVHRWASWSLSTPSDQHVSLSKEESLVESPFVVGRGTPSRA